MIKIRYDSGDLLLKFDVPGLVVYILLCKTVGSRSRPFRLPHLLHLFSEDAQSIRDRVARVMFFFPCTKSVSSSDSNSLTLNTERTTV